ncbi:hypothetical protein NKI31_12630 [Mesorhizobium sp. M0659]|uniref:hypothetical protein n=1 Tax=Mesorhizobium sp. M0659 TaxID=2956980 RepID=UPI0033362CEB
MSTARFGVHRTSSSGLYGAIFVDGTFCFDLLDVAFDLARADRWAAQLDDCNEMGNWKRSHWPGALVEVIALRRQSERAAAFAVTD